MTRALICTETVTGRGQDARIKTLNWKSLWNGRKNLGFEGSCIQIPILTCIDCKTLDKALNLFSYQWKESMDTPHFITLHFIDLCFIVLHRYYGFFVFFLYFYLKKINKLKVSGNPVSNKSIGTIFPMALAHFMSVCHILVILAIFQAFSLLVYLWWWSIISDLWCH